MDNCPHCGFFRGHKELTCRARAEQAEAQNEALTAALKPFADLQTAHVGFCRYWDKQGPGACNCPVREFRTVAHAALDKAKEVKDD